MEKMYDEKEKLQAGDDINRVYVYLFLVL